jgi:hypothetical protein
MIWEGVSVRLEVVASVINRTYLDDFIARELELGDVGCITCHEISVKYTKDRLVGDDEEVILFTLKL